MVSRYHTSSFTGISVLFKHDGGQIFFLLVNLSMFNQTILLEQLNGFERFLTIVSDLGPSTLRLCRRRKLALEFHLLNSSTQASMRVYSDRESPY